MTEETISKEDFQNLEKRVAVLEKLLSSKSEISATLQDKSLSLREFMDEKKPANDVQRTVVIGYFLEHYKRMTSFNIGDIEKEFRGAKIVPPQNVNDKINMAVRRGLVMEDPEKKNSKKAWVLTGTGEKAAEKGFGKQ